MFSKSTHKNVRCKIYTSGSIYRKCMLSRKRRCDQSQGLHSTTMRLIARNCSKIPQRRQVSDGGLGDAETRVYVACTRSRVLHSITVCSITGSLGSNIGALDLVSGCLITYVLDRNSHALERTNKGYDSFLAHFNPFKPYFTLRTYSILKH